MTDISELNSPAICWVCGGSNLELRRPSQITAPLGSDAFRITDAHYGQTASIFQCRSCGFMQCSDLGDVLRFYERMDDSGYEDTRDARALQMGKLLDLIGTRRSSGRLLDIGAGSGILVEEALRRGYVAEGIEPSQWLTERAAERGLPVHLGALPNPAIAGGYDIVTLIDVVEHVSDPVGILGQLRSVMADNGIGVIVTPDVRSFAARILGWRWWHFRIAHIGYFTKATLTMALERSGLEVVSWSRPTWYFHGDYVFDRLMRYLPGSLRTKAPGFTKNVMVPLNMFDSLMTVVRKRPEFQA